MKMRIYAVSFIFFLVIVPTSFAFAFSVYTETNYKNQPDLSKYGVKDVAMIYAQNFWSKGQDRQLPASKERVTKYVAGKYANYTGLLVLDIEQWPLIGSDAQVATRLNKSIGLLEWVKSAAPKAKVGYYSQVPTTGYWPCQKGGSTYRDWQKKNDRTQALADRVDVFFPSLYPYEADQSKWVRYAVCVTNEAQRLGKGKPIYPFINPRYHSKAYGGLPFKTIPEDFIALQLKTLRQGVSDGVVLWAAGNANNQWSESLPWWQATKKFLGLQ